ncbi:hypothetical protein BH10CHL1_BH10CHL1_26440 [soil metagenome]
MDDILTYEPSRIATAIKANLYAFFRYLRRASQTEFFTSPVLTRWHTTTAHPWFNGVLAGPPCATDAPQLVRATLDYFIAHQVEHITWWPEPDVEAAAWVNYLQPLGFHYDNSIPGMAADLTQLQEDIRLPANFRIAPVTNFQELHEWAQTFIAGYELPANWANPLEDLMAGIGIDLPIRHYIGYLDDKPVATSNLFLAAGVAGIQCVATLPAARGQGIGAALTLAPLLDARQLGYRVGILQASTLGFGVYQRLGFQQYCVIDHFAWHNQRALE